MSKTVTIYPHISRLTIGGYDCTASIKLEEGYEVTIEAKRDRKHSLNEAYDTFAADLKQRFGDNIFTNPICEVLDGE